jgi:broad specificity phosphatase PhoE
MDLYFARHGETEYNRIRKLQGRGIDASLNETGRRQARALARYFEKQQPGRIISSTLKRSRETAQFVADLHSQRVNAITDLSEMSFGIYEGRWIKDVKHELQRTHERWASGEIDHALEGGESPVQVLKRAKPAVLNSLKQYEDDARLLFVLHGRLLRILLSDFLGYGLERMHEIPHSNGCIHHLKWIENEFQPVELHITRHLETLEQAD